jgi:hypothetical protein
MNDTVNVIEICESFEYGVCDLGDDLDVDGADAFIYPIKGTLIHKLHADTNVRIRQEGAVERNDVSRVTVVHDVKFAQNLLTNGRLRIDENDLFQEHSECRHSKLGTGWGGWGSGQWI